MTDSDTLIDRYFAAWSTTDADERHELVQAIFAEDAQHHATPPGITIAGRAAIEGNIARINRDNLIDKGLSFGRGKYIPNHNSIQVERTVSAPDGTVIGGGRDFLILNTEGQIQTLYMFND